MKAYEREQLNSQPQIMGIGTLVNEGENGLIRVLSNKADADDVTRLNKIKSNKEDTENMIDLIVE